jgi:hypothetical protein
MQMPLKLFPNDIIDHYNLRKKALIGYVYMEIWRGMYGLPQAGILANKLLHQRLGHHGYFEVQHTPGLWKHVSRPIWFNLCTNNIGVEYISDKNLKHLFSALHTEMYKNVEDWAGNVYCGINLKWNYDKRWVDIDLTRYKHLPPLKPQHCLHTPNPITCGEDNQATTPNDSSLLVKAAGKKRIVGIFLYYAHAVNPTILMVLLVIATQQSAPTEETLACVSQFLDYMWTHPNAKIRYRASDMILNIHSDASYLSAPKACSHAGGYFFLGSIPQDTKPIFINGAIHITCTILKLMAASAAEAELGALFLNAQEAKVI